jgi:hypothetical protein
MEVNPIIANMKRLIIICEGQTEVEFCKDVLLNHFLKFDIIIQTPLIKKSGGGIVPWSTLKTQIQKHLSEGNNIVTTFIDYYGIPDKYNYPGWSESTKIPDKNSRMNFLEEEMKKDIEHKLNHHFIPYIQLHEFEGLLFNNIDVFDQNFNLTELNSRDELVEIIKAHSNPELINNGSTTAPSKRLQRIVSGYHKIVHGAILAEEIGLQKIRDKSPRFNNWLDNLEQI